MPKWRIELADDGGVRDWCEVGEYWGSIPYVAYQQYLAESGDESRESHEWRATVVEPSRLDRALTLIGEADGCGETSYVEAALECLDQADVPRYAMVRIVGVLEEEYDVGLWKEYL